MNDVFWTRQVKIAKATMKLNDVGVMVMGGMTKEQARKILWIEAAKKKMERKMQKRLK